jgi:hypothetical protein
MQTTFQSPTVEERKLAILAHGSILLTFLLAVTTGGVGVLAAVLVPFFIWLLYRDRSPYIAFHALQATLYQMALISLFLALAGVVAIILLMAWVITAALSILLIGLLLVPIAVGITAIAGVLLAAFPLAGLAYGLVAAWEVYNTNNFRYRWIADWLEQKL